MGRLRSVVAAAGMTSGFDSFRRVYRGLDPFGEFWCVCVCMYVCVCVCVRACVCACACVHVRTILHKACTPYMLMYNVHVCAPALCVCVHVCARVRLAVAAAGVVPGLDSVRRVCIGRDPLGGYRGVPDLSNLNSSCPTFEFQLYRAWTLETDGIATPTPQLIFLFSFVRLRCTPLGKPTHTCPQLAQCYTHTHTPCRRHPLLHDAALDP